MSEKIKITCPRCGHEWKASLGELKRDEVVYRDAVEKQKSEVVKYRAVCPNDGTYIIVEVQED